MVKMSSSYGIFKMTIARISKSSNFYDKVGPFLYHFIDLCRIFALMRTNNYVCLKILPNETLKEKIIEM